VTGPRGLLGATLVRVLREAGMNVHAYEGDITDRQAVMSFVALCPTVDAIVHTAAATDVNRCERESEWCTSVNVEGTRNVRDAATARDARFVFISTVSVFSGLAGNDHEEDAVDPRNQYNLSKLAGERLTSEYERGLTLRINIIGIHPDGSRGKNFMEWLVDSFRAHKDMKLFTDVRINPLSNWTLAECIRDILMRWPDARVLHVGSRTLLSKADIGRLVRSTFPEYTGTIEYISSDALLTSAFRPKEMWLNVDKAQSLGLKMPTLESEVERILTSYFL